VLHAGDMVSPFVVSKFAKLRAKLHYVWGNNDGDRELLSIRFAEIGVKPLGNFAALELAGRKIALLHGTHEEIVQALLRSGSFDVVVRGHNHRAGVVEGRTLCVNPGEVCGYLTGRQTVAELNLDAMRAEILDL
jgi:putative phosphoesterase